MAITFENVIQTRVIDGLYSLIADEFSLPIHFDEHKGHSFLIQPITDNLIEITGNSQARDYSTAISYQVKASGNYTKNSIKQVTEVTERLKRLIFNNTSYSPSSSYKWHDGRVISIEYLRDEDDPSLISSLSTFNCTSTEVY